MNEHVDVQCVCALSQVETPPATPSTPNQSSVRASVVSPGVDSTVSVSHASSASAGIGFRAVYDCMGGGSRCCVRPQ